MKRTFFIILMLLMIHQVSNAQFSFGIRGGLNFANLPEQTFQLDDTQTEIRTLSDSYTGFHVGVMGHISLLGVFIMPEILFVSTGNDLVLTQGEENVYYKQKFSQLDIPVMVGAKIGPIRAGLGPVATILLNSESGLSDANSDYRARFNSATYGIQVGAGLNLGNMAIDLKYQFGLSNLGDGIVIGERTYAFDTRPRQLVLSIGFLF